MNVTKLLMAALVVMTLTACTEEEGQRVPLGEDTTTQPRGRETWSPEMTALVDSANAAYAAGEYQTAAEIFRSLTEEHPDVGTVWFGLYMAEDAMGNAEAATTALERAEAINPGLGRMHEEAEAGAEAGAMMPGMPAGHPSMDSIDPEDAPPLQMQSPAADTSDGP